MTPSQTSSLPRPSPMNTGPLASLVRGGSDAAEGVDFLQAMRLLEQYVPGGLNLHESLRPGAARIAVRPHEGLAFPAADVRGLEPLKDGQQGARLIVTFLGLYGVDSPLPSYFSTAALGRTEDDAPAVRDFLDIFNTRIYALLYETLKKYRPALCDESAKGTRTAERFVCLAGLGAPAKNGVVPLSTLIPFAGVFRTPVRNAEGLVSLIAHLFPTLPTTIVENVPRWITVPSRPRLGRQVVTAVLGETALLGQRVLDVSGRFRVVLGPVDWAQFERLRPGGRDAATLDEIVKLYAPDSLDYEVELRIRSTELPVTRLGSPSNRMGRTTWAGWPRDTIISEVVTYA